MREATESSQKSGVEDGTRGRSDRVKQGKCHEHAGDF